MATQPYSGETAYGATVDAPTLLAPSASVPPAASASRVTTLPRVEDDGEALRLVPEVKARYEPLKLLGAGGMGEVVLVQDNDIARKVAVKRLLPDRSGPATLARFVDEVRTVGRLEHPSIVPIHDVGVDEEGRYYFVMKYVEGETLESIIEKLAAGDPEAHRRYTVERRAEIFMSLLQALAYAHAHGVVHRDVKPANVMVGRYGEVMLMDWGIAKPVDAARDFAAGAEATLAEHERGGGKRGRMYATRVGTLVGTPAYMSPEQARGENERVGARSDLYSACVLFHELLTSRHYLAGKKDVDEMIDAVAGEEISRLRFFSSVPGQPKTPAELLHFIERGLQKDPARRHASAAEMIDELQAILEGRMDVECHVTLQKRLLREAGRFVDRHSLLSLAVLLCVLASLVFAGVQIVRMAAA